MKFFEWFLLGTFFIMFNARLGGSDINLWLVWLPILVYLFLNLLYVWAVGAASKNGRGSS